MFKRMQMVALLSVFTLLAVGGAGTVAAQDESMTDLSDFSSLEGLQQVISRTYGPDMEAVMAAMLTPAADGTATTSIDDMLANATYLTTLVMRYDNADNAERGFNAYYDEAKRQSEAEETASFEEVELDDLGDEARGMKNAIDEGAMATHFFSLLIRDGAFNYIVVAVANDDAVNQLVIDVAKEMLANEPGDGDGAFDHDGASTGGLWDILPANGDPVLGSLSALGDELTFPTEP